MLTYGRCIDTGICPSKFRVRLGVKSRQIKLRRTRQTVADLLPMYQVLTMEYWYTWEVLEGTVHQIEVIADTADTWIGMETRKYWVFISLC